MSEQNELDRYALELAKKIKENADLKAKLEKAINRINYYQDHNVACMYRLTYAHKFENADPCNCYVKDFIEEISP